MKCPFCGQILEKKSYYYHRTKTACVLLRKGIFICKCEKFSSDKYYDFYRHLQECNYQYDDTKINRYDFTFEQKYQIEKAKVDVYENILNTIFKTRDISELLNIKNAVKEYKIQEYNEKFVSESELSEKKIECNVENMIDEKINNIFTDIQEGIVRVYEDIMNYTHIISERLDIFEIENVHKLLICINYNIFYDFNKQELKELKEFQETYIKNVNLDNIMDIYRKYCCYLTDINIFESFNNIDNLYFLIIGTFDLQEVFKRLYIYIFNDYIYHKEILNEKHVLYQCLLNTIILSDENLFKKYFLKDTKIKISRNDITFHFDTINDDFNDSIYSMFSNDPSFKPNL